MEAKGWIKPAVAYYGGVRKTRRIITIIEEEVPEYEQGEYFKGTPIVTCSTVG